MRIRILMMLVVAFFIVDIKATDTKRENSFDYSAYNDQWELVKEEAGIQIFYKTIAKDGVFQLRVKFVNTKNEAVKFNWSLSKKSDLVFEDIQVDLMSNESIEKDENLVIPFNSGDSSDDFLMTLKIK